MERMYIDYLNLAEYMHRQIQKAEKDNNHSQLKYWHKTFGLMQDQPKTIFDTDAFTEIPPEKIDSKVFDAGKAYATSSAEQRIMQATLEVLQKYNDREIICSDHDVHEIIDIFRNCLNQEKGEEHSEEDN